MDQQELDRQTRCAYWYYQGRRTQAYADAEYGSGDDGKYYVRGRELREVWAEALADVRQNWPDVDISEMLNTNVSTNYTYYNCTTDWLLQRSSEIAQHREAQQKLRSATLGARKENDSET